LTLGARGAAPLGDRRDPYPRHSLHLIRLRADVWRERSSRIPSSSSGDASSTSTTDKADYVVTGHGVEVIDVRRTPGAPHHSDPAAGAAAVAHLAGGLDSLLQGAAP